jgi:hypothetical protein
MQKKLNKETSYCPTFALTDQRQDLAHLLLPDAQLERGEIKVKKD